MRRTWALVAVLAMTAVAGVGCASDDTLLDKAKNSAADGGIVIDGERIATKDALAKAKEAGPIKVYSGAGQQSQDEADAQFTKDTGLKVSSVNLSPSDLGERILSEKGAGKFAGDFVVISDPTLAAKLDDAKVFSKATVPAAYGIDKANVHAGGRYYTTMLPIYGFAYNTEVVDAKHAPKSWADLTGPRYQKNAGIVQAAVGGSAAALTRFQFAELGEDWLKDYKANKARVFQSMASGVEALGRGDVAVTTTTFGTARTAQADGAPIQFVVPKEGFAVYDYYAATSDSGKNEVGAQIYLNWMLSKRGQKFQVADGAYSVRSDVAAPKGTKVTFPTVTSKRVFRMTPEVALAYRDKDIARWNKIFGYSS